MATKKLEELEKERTGAGGASTGTAPISVYRSGTGSKQETTSKQNPRTIAMQKYLSDTVGGVPTESDLLRDVREKLMNRSKFSYDHNTDSRFQQYLDTAKRSGKMAMRDTIAKASSMTGGYANSYAESAGQLAYNDYLQDANEMIPEFEELARARYDAETAALGDKYAILKGEHEEALNDYWNRYGIAREDWYNEQDRQAAEAQYADEKKQREIELLLAMGDYDSLDRMGYSTQALRAQQAAEMTSNTGSGSTPKYNGLSDSAIGKIEEAYSGGDYAKVERLIYNAYVNGDISEDQSLIYLDQYSKPLSSYKTMGEIIKSFEGLSLAEIKNRIATSDLSNRKKEQLYNRYNITP